MHGVRYASDVRIGSGRGSSRGTHHEFPHPARHRPVSTDAWMTYVGRYGQIGASALQNRVPTSHRTRSSEDSPSTSAAAVIFNSVFTDMEVTLAKHSTTILDLARRGAAARDEELQTEL